MDVLHHRKDVRPPRLSILHLRSAWRSAGNLAISLAYHRAMDDRAERATSVRERAAALGFDLVGFASAAPFDRERELILEDLSRGRMQGMGWITPDRVRLSCDPEQLLPGVRSIVALGTSYAPAAAAATSDPVHGRVA